MCGCVYCEAAVSEKVVPSWVCSRLKDTTNKQARENQPTTRRLHNDACASETDVARNSVPDWRTDREVVFLPFWIFFHSDAETLGISFHKNLN